MRRVGLARPQVTLALAVPFDLFLLSMIAKVPILILKEKGGKEGVDVRTGGQVRRSDSHAFHTLDRMQYWSN